MGAFSQLPQQLIDRILYFLPAKEAARTSILSKELKSAWDSRSMVDLDLRLITPYDKLQEFMKKTLESYVQQGLGVEKLRISWMDCMVYHRARQILPLIHQWLDFVFSADNNLKELEISGLLKMGFCRQKRLVCSKPTRFRLNLRGSNTLTTLNLCYCKFENISENIKFPSLQNLALKFTPLTSDIIHTTFLSGSPFLKSLSLSDCYGLESLEVSGLVRIISVSISFCDSLKRVKVNAPNLRDFSFTGIPESPRYKYEINLAACEESLKQLRLQIMELLPTNDECWLQTMVSRFVSLELLDLYDVYSSNKEAIKISSPSLSELVIRSCKILNEDTIIDAPNLRSVKFMYNKCPFYSLPTSNNLSQVQFSFYLDKELHKSKELFAKTNHIKDMRMTILCEDQPYLIFHEDISYLLLNNIIHNLDQYNLNGRLQVTIYSSLRSEGWLQSCLHINGYNNPLSCSALYIASSHNTNFVKDFYESVSRWKRTLWYCQYERRKCWKPDLQDIQIEKLNLQEDTNTTGGQYHINGALLQAYQALSYNLARINFQLYSTSN